MQARSIGQKIALPGALNTLTLTLSTNAALPTGSTLHVTNFGAVLPAGGSAWADAPAGNFRVVAGKGVGVEQGSASVTGQTWKVAMEGELLPGQLYVLAFNVTNPATAQAAPALSICANLDAAHARPKVSCVALEAAAGASEALLVRGFYPKMRDACSNLGSTWANINNRTFGRRKGFGMVALNGVPLVGDAGGGDIFEEGVWDAERKTMVFAVGAGQTVRAGARLSECGLVGGGVWARVGQLESLSK